MRARPFILLQDPERSRPGALEIANRGNDRVVHCEKLTGDSFPLTHSRSWGETHLGYPRPTGALRLSIRRQRFTRSFKGT